MEASAPLASHIEPEPPVWQPRALWATARLLAGAAAFFFLAFVFAYFYLRTLDVNKGWKIGSVSPPVGWGLAITLVLVASAVCFWAVARRPFAGLRLGVAALVLALLAVVLQVIEWTTLDFGGINGAYASVFIGWTAFTVVFALPCIYWLETQVASIWRAQREGIDRPRREGVPADDVELLKAGVQACSFFWTFYVACGVVAFLILYLV
jgi:heme/copper-type cytochrome/quinol oxidase subunit 3